MKKTLSIVLSSALALLLFSGCDSSSSDEKISEDTTPTSATTSVEENYIIDTSPLAQKANRIKIALAKEGSNQRAINQNISSADIIYMLSEKSDILDETNIKTYSLYKHFKENYVDTNILSNEDLDAFERMSVTEFNAQFVRDYFGVEATYSNEDLNAYTYMKDELNNDNQDQVLKHFYTILLDYPLLVDEFTTISSSLDSFVEISTNVFKDSFFEVRKNNPEIEPKIRALLEKAPYISAYIFLSLFNEEHKAYHRAHLDTAMYTSMVDTALILQDQASPILSSMVNLESFTLPSDENASPFSKEFFNIGTTERGDGNELATEKLLMLWSSQAYIPTVEYIGLSDDNTSLETLETYEQSDEDKEIALAYLDFMYLGLVPGSLEADEAQATNFAFAREAGLNLRSALRVVLAENTTVVQKTGSLDFLQSYAFPIYNISDSVASLRVFSKIGYDRFLPYMYQYIQSSYAYYVSGNEENKEQIVSRVSTTLTSIIDNYEYYEYEERAKQRSGGISAEGLYEFVFVLYSNFSDLSLFDQMNFFVDYIFNDVNGTKYFGGDSVELQAQITNQYDLNISAYVENSDDAWLTSLSNAAYRNVELYNSDATWEYLPLNLSNLEHLARNSESENLEYNFNFDGGYVYLYVISQESTTELKSYGYAIKRLQTDRILSQLEDEVYKLYRIKVYSNDEKNYDFSSLFAHSEAILIDSANVYVPKTQATLDQEKADAEAYQELLLDTNNTLFDSIIQ